MNEHTTPPLCGIYRITNAVTGDCYIGSSTNIEKRWRTHQTAIARQYHHNHHLQHAWRKYGADSFSLSVLTLCPPDMLTQIEQQFIDVQRPTYNIAPKAGQGPGMRGKRHSPETLARLSKIPFGEERRTKMREAHKKRWTPEARVRQRLSHLGHHPSPESIQKSSTARRGKPLSPETRKKIGMANAAHSHQPHSAEVVKKMTAFQKTRRAREKAEGKPLSDKQLRQLVDMRRARVEKRGRSSDDVGV